MKYPIYYLDDSNCVTTPEEFCAATGWPEEEWMGLKMNDAIELLAFYGLRMNEMAAAANAAYEAGLDDGFKAASEVYRGHA